MKILFLKKTTDSDLFKGLEVAYCDKSGQYTLSGKIEAITYGSDGIAEYTVKGANYLASELKLIEVGLIDNFDSLRNAVIETGNFVPVTEDLYYYALAVVPPNYLNNGTFQMGEEVSENMYFTFGDRNGKYYGCLCNKNFALNNF